MKYTSVRGTVHPVTFRQALFEGLATDGSLFVPREFPTLPQHVIDDLASADYHHLGHDIISMFVDDIPSAELFQIFSAAVDFPIPLVNLDSELYLLELFHGPTLAFKDVGARFMARVLSHYLVEDAKTLTLLVATSGDTGSAVASGFYNIPNIEVYVLYPSGKISRLQEQQMTTLGGNIHAIEVDGTFDDCQHLVKSSLSDREIREKHTLTTANSINLGRLVPQITYYAWSVAQLWCLHSRRPLPVFVVPSGNFGNMTAAAYAGVIGIPMSGLVAATNANDVVPKYLRTGQLVPRPSLHTLSNAMDVGNPSNIARLQLLWDNDLTRIRKHMSAQSISNEVLLDEMRRTFDSTGYMLDPHTSVGVSVARGMIAAGSNVPIIVPATAHPAKFPEVIEQATGQRITLPDQLARTLHLPKLSRKMSSRFEGWKDFLLSQS